MSPLKVTEVRLVPGEQGEVAIASLNWAGRVLSCGTGVRSGGVMLPHILPAHTRSPEVLVTFDAQGRPIRMLGMSRSSAMQMDFDGDGLPHELVRWSTYCDYDRAPFLIVHDLTDPALPVMLNLILNPEAGRESFEIITIGEDREEVNEEGIRILRSATRRGQTKREPDRHGELYTVPSNEGRSRDLILTEN